MHARRRAERLHVVFVRDRRAQQEWEVGRRSRRQQRDDQRTGDEERGQIVHTAIQPEQREQGQHDHAYERPRPRAHRQRAHQLGLFEHGHGGDREQGRHERVEQDARDLARARVHRTVDLPHDEARAVVREA